MDAELPSQIGRYRVERLLGAGAMGFVFLARDPQLDRPVAIKTVRATALDPDAQQRYLERFRNEARAAARVHHPAIVQVHDAGEDPRVGPYLVMEYVAGRTLKQWLRERGPLEPELVLRLVEQVGEGIDHAHAAGVLHRDIKPDNLLITDEGRVKLADFGVARLPDAALTREGQFLGTPCYAAPETLSQGRYGPSSDLFSLAAVLYEAVSGERAFPGDEAATVVHRVLHEEPPPPSRVVRAAARVHPAVDAVILRGLSKNPADRYPDARELALALRAAYEEAGLLEGRRDPTGRTAPAETDRGGRGRDAGGVGWPALLAGGGALLVGVALVLSSSGTGAPDAHGDPDATVRPDADATAASGSVSSAIPADRAHSRSSDDAAPRVLVTNGPVDGGASRIVAGAAPDAGGGVVGGASTPEPPRGHRREEAAKDALDRARDALEAGDVAEARRHLEEARRLDPGSPDLGEFESRLEAALRRMPGAGAAAGGGPW
ncbi:MAG: serine/threonine protein kinase [Myxococcota bacterium]|nr:serine/threonine protein kinase [Myxococcota bacterium]MDW8361615.1 serine/threonine-protein kinase [Myxococcales bacterium]